MKIYAIIFIVVAGLSFSLAIAPLDTLHWLFFVLEMPHLLFGILAAIILLVMGAALSAALCFPAIAIIAYALIAGYLDNRAGQ